MVTSRSEELGGNYRTQLVTILYEKGAIRTPSIAQAFAVVSREAFVPSFYDRPPGQRTWEIYTSENREPADWLALVYQDRSLVTRITGETPTSSSSRPSVMAQMLEALEVQLGQRVLEIGTGTGYNAALLAELAGNPTLVTTIDLDEDLTNRARQILHQVVGQVFVAAHDGNQGEASHAPYDRIIVTASASFLPQAWYAQLAPGGRLVVALQGSLGASGFLVIEKASNGQSALGKFLAPPLHFMPLRTLETSSLASARELFQKPVGSDVELHPRHPFLTLLHDSAFRWFLQWWWPGTIKIDQATMTKPGRKELLHILMDQGHQTILQLKQGDGGRWRGKHHGGFPLWETIEQAIEEFSAWGDSERRQYQVQLDEREAWLQVCDAQEHIHRIRNLSQC